MRDLDEYFASISNLKFRSIPLIVVIDERRLFQSHLDRKDAIELHRPPQAENVCVCIRNI